MKDLGSTSSVAEPEKDSAAGGHEYPADGLVCPDDVASSGDRVDFLLGQTLAGKYLIEEALGTGGMCLVYRARHILMDKTVAVKVLRPALGVDEQIVQRFQLEARAASRINHPHAINVTDFGSTPQGSPFMVMDYIQGEPLSEVLRRHGALTANRAGLILRQVCGALEAAHAEGVVHRDIKPENIIVSEYDGRDWVTVVDFGVAKIQEDLNKRCALTGENHIVGTPRYMSPEQAEDRPVDARSDIYSLGVVLYEMLAGETPFKDDSATRLLVKHASEPPPPLSQARPDLPPEVAEVVMTALEKEADRRYQSAAELAIDFDRAAGIAEAAAVDRGGAFSRITVPIAGSSAARNRTPIPDGVGEGETTLVRPRTPAETPSSLPLPGRATAPLAASHTAWPVVVGLLLMALVGTLAFAFYKNRSSNDPAADAISQAQQAVTDARARIESLPKEHALSGQLPQLIRWEGELNGFTAAPEVTPEMRDKAAAIGQKAGELSAQAKSALAALPREAAPKPVAPAPPRAGESEAAGQKDEKKDKARTEEPVEGEEVEGEGGETPAQKRDKIEEEAKKIIEELKEKARGGRPGEGAPVDPGKKPPKPASPPDEKKKKPPEGQ